MQRLVLCTVATLLMTLVTSCRNPPSKPNFGSSGVNKDDIIRDEPIIGDKIKDGKDTDSYSLLKCEKPETFRGIRGWRRLSNTEIKNTVADIFGLTAGVDFSEFPADLPKHEIFDTVNVVSNYVDTNRFKGYQSFAKTLAEKLDMAKFLPCAAEGSSCLSAKLPSVLNLVWRRPATADEVTALVTLFDVMRKDGVSPTESMRWLVQAMVLSHHFLYRSELGEIQADGSFILTDWELASALSYTLWRRPPNDSLRKAAAAGELSKDGAIRPLATKMMADPLAKSAWKDFAAMWMDSEKINRTEKPLIPAFTPAVKTKMIQEIGDLFSHVMFDSKTSTYQQLLTGDYTIADPLLDSFYDSKSTSGQTTFVQPERRGILGQSGFLASHAAADSPNPILRGVFVAEHMLCINFTKPPPFTPLMSKQGLSNKDLFRQHNKPGCDTCHTLIDNIGFAFENFDQIGKFRSMDAGAPIVTESKLTLDGKELQINSPQALFTAIGNSNQGMQCFVREAFRYSFGRAEFYNRPLVGGPSSTKITTQSELDRCQIENATAAMKANKGDLRTGIIELVSSPAFKIRLIGKIE
jgi:hypothetical protein